MAEFSAEFIGMEHASADIKSISVQLRNYALSIEELTKALSGDIKSLSGIQRILENISEGVMEQSQILSEMAGVISICAYEYNISERELCMNTGSGGGGGYTVNFGTGKTSASSAGLQQTEVQVKTETHEVSQHNDEKGFFSAGNTEKAESEPASDYTGFGFEESEDAIPDAGNTGKATIAFALAGGVAAAAVLGADKLSKSADGRGIDEKAADKIIEFVDGISGKGGDGYE